MDEIWAEGMYRGSLARALVTDAPLWPAHLPEIPHVPGSMLMGALAAPFYLALGPTTFAMRMSGTLMHLAALALFFWLLQRRFGNRAATWCSWLFVLAPPGLAKISVLSYGDHVESLPFILFAAVFALEWAGGVGSRLLLKAFLAGLGVSLAMTFHLQGTLGIGALAAVCAMVVPPRLRTAAFWKELGGGFVPGLALGAIPALVVFRITGSSAFSLWGSNPLEHMSSEAQRGEHDPVGKFISLIRDGYSWTLQYEHRGLADATLLLAAACAIGLLVAGVRRWRRGEAALRELLLAGGFPILYPIVFSLAYATSSDSFRISDSTANAIEVRYAMPVVPFLLLPIGLAAARLFDAGRRAFALCLLVPALALGACGSLSTCSLQAMLREPARRGYLWESFDGHFTWGALPQEKRAGLDAATHDIKDRQEREDAIERYVVEHADPKRFVEIVRRCDDTAEWTWPLRYHAPVGNVPLLGPKALGEWLRPLTPETRPFALASAAGKLAGEEDFQQGSARALLHAAREPGETRTILRAFGDGLFTLRYNGHAMLPRFFDEKPVVKRLAELPPWMDRAEVVFGFGFRVGRILHEWYQFGDPIMMRMLASLPKELHEPFARGIGAGYRMRFLAPPPGDLVCPSVTRITKKLTVELEAQFRAGLGGSEAAK